MAKAIPDNSVKKTDKSTDVRLKNLKPPWKKGVSPNPGGRPKGSGLTNLLLTEIEKVNPSDKNKKTWKQLIVEATMRLAIKGNAAALREIWERIDGKVSFPITGPDGEGLTIVISKDFKPDKIDSKGKNG